MVVSPEKPKQPEPANDGDESPWDSSEAEDEAKKSIASKFQAGLKANASPTRVGFLLL